LLLVFPAPSSAQSLPPCDPQTVPAIVFEGLPSGLAPARWEEFGFRENFDTDSYVSGRITVEMRDRFGKSFFRGPLPEHARGGRLLRVFLDRETAGCRSRQSSLRGAPQANAVVPFSASWRRSGRCG
jgi:hypothetical protein